MAKDASGLIVLILGLPTLVALFFLGINSMLVLTGSMNVSDYSQQWGQTVVDLVTPWWLPLMSLGIIGVIALVVLVFLFGKGVLDA
jgi:hypothetical protein